MAKGNESQYARAMRSVRQERKKNKERGAGTRGHAKEVGRCGAKRASGEGTCNNPKGLGTDHFGIGRCKFHGGATPNGRLNAAKQQAVFMGAPKEINPVEAMIWCIHVTAGEVEWYGDRLAEIEKADWYESTVIGKQMHILARERANAVERLEKFSKDALSLGIAERAVRLAEQYGSSLARLLKGVLEDLELTEEQKKKAPSIVRKHLILLEGGRSEMKALAAGSMKEVA